MILDLSLNLLERLGLIIIFAFLMSKNSLFKNYLRVSDNKFFKNILFAVVWGGLGILMTNLGTPYNGSIVNSRTIPVVLAGILGGPFVGVLAGMIAGFHRAFIAVGGDITAISCGISAVFAGLIGGLYNHVFNQNNRKSIHGFLLGLFAETLQMALILLIAKPFPEALALVKVIFIPMTLLNALGIFIFLLIVEQIYEDTENVAASKTEISLRIANQTLSYLKQGLNIETAKQTVEIIRDNTGYCAVSITNRDAILYHTGIGSDHHKSGDGINVGITERVLHNEVIELAYKKSDIGCAYPECPFKTVIGIPLTSFGETIGALKIYFIKGQAVRKSDIELAKGLGILFSSQLELGKLEAQKSLREEAEMNALRAQIKPHFIFNSLNAIMSMIRTDGEKARILLQELSIIIRNGFKENKQYINLSEEIRLVEAYLSIEKARFADKLNFSINIDKDIETLIPPLIIQPLVENAVKHGIRHKDTAGNLVLNITAENDFLHVVVEDDGVGMGYTNDDSLEISNGIGLKNITDRLKNIYNSDIKILSEENEGTRVSYSIPIMTEIV